MNEKKTEWAVTLKNTYFTYNKGKTNEFQALKNVSLDIPFDQFVIIFGPSGCGKSTLLNVIAGLETPDEGSVFVLKRDLMNLKKNDFAEFHRKEIGMIYQQYNLITSLSVLDNVALPQIFVNVSKRKRDEWSKKLLERFGILQHARKIPTELSGGQQQRIGIARSIVNNPEMILADEPVGNLDSKSAENVLQILMELNEKEKKTIILVTHNPEYLYVADRIIYMKDGVILKEEINREKGIKKQQNDNTYSLKTKSPTATISDLMRAYHGLSPEQINVLIMPYKSKVFVHHFVTEKSMEETGIFEDIIQRRLLSTISSQEFFDILNRPSKEGGVGFDIRTTKKITARVEKVLQMAYFVNQKYRQRKNEKGGHDLVTDDEKTDKIFKYLLDVCYHEYYEKLDEEQNSRLRKAVKSRLIGKAQKNEFFTYVDDSVKNGGVGLNSKTAKSITEEIELILVLAFGMVQSKRRPVIKNKKQENNNEESKELENKAEELKNKAINN